RTHPASAGGRSGPCVRGHHDLRRHRRCGRGHTGAVLMVTTTSPTYGVGIFPQYPPDEFARHCQRVDAHGFERLWIPDERFFRDLGVQLTLAAVHTQRVEIGSAVTDPYIRHPALTATMMA